MKVAGKEIHWSLVVLSATIGILLLLQLLVLVFLQPLVGQAIRSSVSYFSDDLYQVDFDKVRVQLFRKAIYLEKVRLTYDTARVQASPALRQGKQYTGTAGSVVVNLHEFSYLLGGRYLSVDRIDVDQPAIYAHRFPEVASTDSTQQDTSSFRFDAFRLIKPYFDSVRVASLQVDGATVGMIRHRPSKSADSTTVQQIDVTIAEAYVDSLAVSQRNGWPRMEEFVIATEDQTFMSSDSLYNFRVDSIRISPLRGTLLVKQFSIDPRWDRYEMGEHLGEMVNWTQLRVQQITADSIDYTVLADSLVIRAGSVAIQQADFTLFRDLRLPSGKAQYRPLLQERMRSVTTPFRIDTITVEASQIRYEERRKETDRAGYIAFQDTYASFYNVTNQPTDSSAAMKVDARAQVMGKGATELHFTFPLTTTQGEHHITGTLDQMALEAFNPTAEPLASVSVKSGVNNRMDFDMQLNEKYASGNVRFKYKNLDLTLLNEDNSDNKKKVKSWLANLLVIKSNNPSGTRSLRPGPIGFERDTTRSVFNYWWRALRSGLEVSVGVDNPSRKAEAGSSSSR